MNGFKLDLDAGTLCYGGEMMHDLGPEPGPQRGSSADMVGNSLMQVY